MLGALDPGKPEVRIWLFCSCKELILVFHVMKIKGLYLLDVVRV